MSSQQATDYERSDVSPWLLASVGGGVAAFLALAPLALQILYPEAMHRFPTQPALGGIAAPRLQIAPAKDLAKLRAAEEERLTSYGWVNRDRGTLHVPIDRAMTLVEKRGLTGWPKE